MTIIDRDCPAGELRPPGGRCLVFVWFALLGASCARRDAGDSAPNQKTAAQPRTGRGAARRAAPKDPGRGQPPASRSRPMLAGAKNLWEPAAPETQKLLDRARAAIGRKQCRAALPWLDQALARRPELAAARYQRACCRARTGDAGGALTDLEWALLGHFPRYAPRARRDGDLAALRQPPHRAAFDRLLAAARARHLAAVKRAVLLIGATTKARRQGDRLLGDQEIVGYLLPEDRYVAVTDHSPANVLAFLVVGDWLVYATASRYRSRFKVPAFADAEVRAMRRGAAQPAVRFRPHGTKGNPSGRGRRQTDDLGDPSGTRDIEANVDSGEYVLVEFQRVTFEGIGVPKKRAGRFHQPLPGRRGPYNVYKTRIQGHFKVTPCGVEANRLALDTPALNAKPHVRAHRHHESSDMRLLICGSPIFPAAYKQRYVVGGRQVSVPCEGTAWVSPEATAMVYRPAAGCATLKPGLYRVAAPNKLSPTGIAAEASGIRWLNEQRFLVQVGDRVFRHDLPAGRTTPLAPPVGFLRAHSPHPRKCPAAWMEYYSR